MKYLVVFSAFLVYFTCLCTVQKCYNYEVNDTIPDKSQPEIETCECPYNAFCASVTFKNAEVPYETCGDDEYCTELSCVSDLYCIEPGTYQHDYPGLRNVRFSMTCCHTNLCINFEKEPEALLKAQHFKKNCFYSSICILVIIIISYSYLVTNMKKANLF